MVRTALFLPATHPERFAKALASGADAVILDLEDAVAPGDKARARKNLIALATCPFILRTNAFGTSWYDGDLAVARRLPLTALMIPKAEDPERLARLDFSLIPLIESARGLAQARQIAALPNVVQLAFGSLDFCIDMGVAHTAEVLLPIRLELVLASRLAGIAAPLDGVTTNLATGFAAADAAGAKSLGMGGKLCIHPKQVAEVQQAFQPSEAELEWAAAILTSGEGVATVRGEMVDEPVRLRARGILAHQQRITASD